MNMKECKYPNTGKMTRFAVGSGIGVACLPLTVTPVGGKIAGEGNSAAPMISVAVSGCSEATEPSEVTLSMQAWLDFRELARQWRAERGATSSLDYMISRPSYLRIIAMGQTAIGFLLQELRHSPDYWFAALRAITNENPVPNEARGNLRKMADAWLRWGFDHTYLSA